MADLSVGKFKRHSIAVLRISYIERPKVKRGNKPKVLICTGKPASTCIRSLE